VGFVQFLTWCCSWRTAFALVGVFGLVASLALFALEVPRHRKLPKPTSFFTVGMPSLSTWLASVRSLIRILRASHCLPLLLVAQTFATIASSAVVHAVPTFYAKAHGASISQGTNAMEILAGVTFPLIAAVGPFSEFFCRKTRLHRLWLTVGLYVAAPILLLPAVFAPVNASASGLATMPILYFILVYTTPTLHLLNILDTTPPQAIGRMVGIYSLAVGGIGSFGPTLIDACIGDQLLSRNHPYPAAMLFFGLVPQALAIVCAVPAALYAKPARASIEAELVDVYGRDAFP